MKDALIEAFYAYVQWLPYNPIIGNRPVAKIGEPKVKMNIEDWRREIGARFPRFVRTAEICVSVVCQLLIHDLRNPFALIIVDRSGGGKTIVVNFFQVDNLTHRTSDLTIASFVTNIAARTEEQLEKIDLLPRIKHKVLTVKELAPIFTDNDDVLRKRLGKFTDILDGEGHLTESGVYGQRGYTGDYLFMMIAASTPFSPRVWKIMVEVGHRFFFAGLALPKKLKGELKAQIKDKNYKVKETECRDATTTFLQNIWQQWPDGVQWDSDRDSELVLDRLEELAFFLAPFRGDIFVYEERSKNGILVHTEPRIEDPSRINQCLYNLMRGHAVACGRNYITEDDLGPAVRVTIDSAPNPRPLLMRALIAHDGKLNVDDVMKVMGVKRDAAKKEMHKLVALGVCKGDILQEGEEDEGGSYVTFGQKKTTIELQEEFRWWLDWGRRVLEGGSISEASAASEEV